MVFAMNQHPRPLTLNWSISMTIYPSDKAVPYVYICTHKETNQFYIGYREVNVRLNRPSHLDLPEYKTSSKVVNPEWENYTWTIVAEFFDPSHAYSFEQQLIFDNWENPLLLNGYYRLGVHTQFRNRGPRGKPSPLKGRPSGKKGIPSPLKGRPSPLKGRPSGKKGIPSPLKGRPSPLKGRPSPLKGKPTGPSPLKGRPSGKKGIPNGPQQNPSGLRGPNGRKGKPAWNKGKPSPLKGIPSGRKGIPTGPSPLKGIPTGKQKNPALEVECTHCGLVGRGGGMTRYHFDNCKMKPNYTRSDDLLSGT
jgi:hypothetical protein